MSTVIACPQCQAQYRVNLSANQSQRVKCSRCGQVFEPSPAPAIAAAPTMAAPVPPPTAKPLSGKALRQLEREIAELSDTLQWLKTVVSFALAVREKDLKLIGDNLTTVHPVVGLAAKIGLLKPSIGIRPATDENAYAKAIEIVGHSVGELDKVRPATFWEQFNNSTRAQRERRQIKIDQIKAAIDKLTQIIADLTAEADTLKAEKSAAALRDGQSEPQIRSRLEKLQDALLEGRIDRDTYEALKADIVAGGVSQRPSTPGGDDEIAASMPAPAQEQRSIPPIPTTGDAGIADQHGPQKTLPGGSPQESPLKGIWDYATKDKCPNCGKRGGVSVGVQKLDKDEWYEVDHVPDALRGRVMGGGPRKVVKYDYLQALKCVHCGHEWVEQRYGSNPGSTGCLLLLAMLGGSLGAMLAAVCALMMCSM